MSPIADVTVDNDLDLYKLDLTNGTLSVVAQSQNPAATYELLSYVAEPGYYFLSVAAFAGEVANQFSFMVRLSDTWDENEADDSLLQAKAQPLNKTVIHTLDNTIDQDISILNVSTSGSYTFALYGLPDNLNYLLQIMNTNMEVLATIPQNSTSLINLPVNSYIIRVLSSDGNIDASVTYKLMVEELPKDVDFNITGNSYTAKLLNDGSHFISVITTKKDNACKIFVDGTFLDYNSIDFETHRVETKSSTSECSITTTKDTTLTRADICSYIGSNENRAKNLKHAISMCLNNVVYGETHSLLSYNAADVSTARNVIKGTDQYNKVYYKGFWRNVDTKYDVWVVWNLDTLEVVDFSHPNWFHGSPSIANYKPYGMPENITITSLTPLVE